MESRKLSKPSSHKGNSDTASLPVRLESLTSNRETSAAAKWPVPSHIKNTTLTKLEKPVLLSHKTRIPDVLAASIHLTPILTLKASVEIDFIVHGELNLAKCRMFCGALPRLALHAKFSVMLYGPSHQIPCQQPQKHWPMLLVDSRHSRGQ
jgi:hypothetical protein